MNQNLGKNLQKYSFFVKKGDYHEVCIIKIKAQGCNKEIYCLAWLKEREKVQCSEVTRANCVSVCKINIIK